MKRYGIVVYGGGEVSSAILYLDAGYRWVAPFIS
jgi:hypothetical protein